MSWSKSIETHTRDVKGDLDSLSDEEIAGADPSVGDEALVAAAKRMTAEAIVSHQFEGPLVVSVSGSSPEDQDGKHPYVSVRVSATD